MRHIVGHLGAPTHALSLRGPGEQTVLRQRVVDHLWTSLAQPVADVALTSDVTQRPRGVGSCARRAEGCAYETRSRDPGIRQGASGSCRTDADGAEQSWLAQVRSPD